jgi:type IV pilus assembly protein PilC
MRNLRLLITILLCLAALAAVVFVNVSFFYTTSDRLVGLAVTLGVMGLGGIYMLVRIRQHRSREAESREEGRIASFRGLDALALFAGCTLAVALLAVLSFYFEVLFELLLGICIALLGLGGLYLVFRLGTAWWRRRTISRVVISQLASVLRQNLPLATALALAADSEQGWARIHLHRIARLLGRGLPLSEAVRRGYRDCPSLVLSLIVAGERAGQLPAAVGQAEMQLIEEARRREHADAPASIYMLIILTAAFLLLSGIMVAVVPKFKEIFKDFGTELPAVTLILINFSEFMAQSGLLALLLVALVFALPAVLYLSLRPRRVPTPALSSRIADWFRWHAPGWRRLEFSRGMAAALGIMRLGTRAGLGLAPAARLAAGIDVNQWLRLRLLEFSQLLEGGANLREAAHRSGLGEVTGIALASGQRAGNLEAGLRFAEDYHAGLVSHWWIFLRSLAWPVTTLTVAVVVGYVVVALFTPLVVLIDGAVSAW